MKKELVSQTLTGTQKSICIIPELLYKGFLSKKIGEEVVSEHGGQTTRWYEVKTGSDDKTEKVCVIFTEQMDGDAMETKFALMPWYPRDEHYRNFYDLEILAKPESKGWTLSEGSRFIETLSWNTQVVNNHPLLVNHPMTDWVAAALLETRRLLKSLDLVRQEFIDHAPKPPR
jgi:hypothetical protein